MNDKYIIVKDSEKNIIQEDGVQAFQFQIRIPYYEGVPFSQIDFIKVSIDGEEVEQKNLRIVAKTGEIFTLQEATTALNFFWEYGEGLRIRVMQGGLPVGEHKLEVNVNIRVIYAPNGFGTYCYDKFMIGGKQ